MSPRERQAGGYVSSCHPDWTSLTSRCPHTSPAARPDWLATFPSWRYTWLGCRYKTEIRREDKHALRDLVKRQHHYALTPEILRELDSSLSRGEQAAGAPDALRPVSKVAAAAGGGGGGEDPRDLAPIILMEDD